MSNEKEILEKYMRSIISISEADLEFFLSRFELVHFPKKQQILKEGETENYLSFINSGILRYYVEGERNDVPFESTFAFAVEGWFSSAYDSFITQEPSLYYVETMTDVELLRISHQHLQEVYKETAMGQLVGRLSAEHLFLTKIRREISLLTKTAEERYLDLFRFYPHFIQQIPLKYLASYIGVTPQALSRIRKTIN